MAERRFTPLAGPFDVVLDGISLVEAGAGTGKTWTITALVLRLLLEQQLEIGQILVVTYTRAATGELRGRIRNRLLQALAAFEAGTTDDENLQALLARYDPTPAAARLRLAIESFDEAAIFTIHSFCQRALTETAFEAGQPFERELLADQQDLLAGVARDVWRKTLATAAAPWARWLLGELGGPDGLVRRVRSHLGRIDAQTLAPVSTDRHAAEQAFAAAFTAARKLWQSDAATICAWLAAAKLNQGVYSPKKMQPRIDLLGQIFAAADAPFPLPEAMAFFGLAKITEKITKSSPPAEHAFFDAVDVLLLAAENLGAAYENDTRRLLHDFLLTARAELTARKRRSGQMAYDDLLADLAHALQGTSGAALAGALRNRYRAALIDEFQDTDPLQLEIFFGIFGGKFGQDGHPLVFVGDPKQAIYGFRGADVFAYLSARQQADAGYALLENRRSDAPLLTVVNALFARPHPFLLEGLSFEPAQPAQMARASCRIDDDTGNAAALTLWTMTQPEGEKGLTKEVAQPLAASAVAADIARLLGLAATGRAQLGTRALAGGDIAVLVRKHQQGELVKQALARRGIASVTLGGGSVWHSDEAEEVERVLLAVAAPTREGLVRAALATVLLGADAAQLAVWAADERAWSERQGCFHDDLLLYRDRGFMAMWRRLLRREGVVARILARPDGERRLTNYRHLAELLQGAEHDGALDIEGLARHLARSREASESEEAQLRLESDAQLVRIVTIHAAKGLQYPIVYCPFLWDGPGFDAKRWPVFAHADNHSCLDFGSAQIDALRQQADLEDAAEELRLAYVALTRAEHRCIVAWGKVNQCERSPLAWLLFAPRTPAAGETDDPRAQLADRLGKLDEAALQAEIVALASGLDGAMAVTPLPVDDAPVMVALVAAAPELVARPFVGTIRAPWRVSSFSSLAARLGNEEIPDHDALVANISPLALPTVPHAGHFIPPVPRGFPSVTPTFSRFMDFPRGARAGSCLHALLERIDFQATAAIGPVAVAVLEEFAYPLEWRPVLERLVADVVATPLNAAGLCLAQVARGERLIELEFTYPLGSAAAQAGYMKGFIDLVFRHGGRWYIVDYKSNWLGEQVEDYTPPRLADVMRMHRYDLQLRIYAAALKRALLLREPDLDWTESFGGVFYLFLRGMGPGSQAGVFFTRPDDALLDVHTWPS
ncbi:MAG: exodeoxyribonuclease V subunit beta [Gammaproteobacteria bacterium]|nr:exodeoxyribonuclease V subunit beta [Rhodocyclaceae bacterium]MBU3909956.1 exodeoxyribonuclease V subunit beta [Gammaproteobacteria bacterium]MBU3987898.1 exodeoxyribonuclease V subunit beta [Gammaproteobacteria bacterium]MBU4003929.1 exodeoxyribonuclease V subunit beta [Gammaproteobacteria bacterium]MBU4020176.1 exodeoxyribonuclease V subunit beta [Gammaproteobacteria bacterium]